MTTESESATLPRKPLARWPLLVMLALALLTAASLYRQELQALWRKWFPRQAFRVVVLDAGHGGKDPGAVAGSWLEKNIVLDLAHRLARQLKQRGCRVIMTRYDDSFLSLPERVTIANRAGNAILVSLHLNTDATGTAEGIETFYHDASASYVPAMDAPPLENGSIEVDQSPISPSEKLAMAVQSALASQTQARDRGIKNRPLHILRYAEVPAILVEVGFISHPDEARLLTSSAYLDLLAQAIASGITIYQIEIQLRSQ